MSMIADTISTESPQLLDDINLHEDDLTEEAKCYFGYHTAIFHAFETYRRSILDNGCLTRAGRHLFLSDIDGLHTTCKRVLNYAAKNIELLSGNFPSVGPLVICGLPRSGTTLLYNLLACDPNCRAPLLTDMFGECVPPIARSDLIEQERRLVAVKFAMQQREKVTGRPNDLVLAHPIYTIEEDYLILRHTSVDILLSQLIFDIQSEPDAWFNDLMTKDFAYDYHETFLRLLNSVDAPRSHWLLKTPMHTFYLDTLLRHYPHAILIMNHRRLDDILSSCCRAHLTRVNGSFDEVDSTSRDRVTKRIIQRIDKMVELVMEFRTRRRHQSDQSHNSIFDVTYNDLMKQPIETVRRIYDHCGLRWSDEFEVAMRSWLRENPQGKQGRHTYSLSEFGLIREDIEARYADYINLFLRSSTEETTKTNQLPSTNKQPESL
jgi:hypothetical protein